MDLKDFTVDTLLLAAIRSEIDSSVVYSALAGRVKNAMLKARLVFLADEEKKHRQLLERIFTARFPGKTIDPPETSEVPLPRITISDELMPLSEIFQMAMNGEKAAYEFYTHLSERFEEADLRKILLYTADMELGHFKILEMEKQNLEKFEEIDQYIPLIHVGP